MCYEAFNSIASGLNDTVRHSIVIHLISAEASPFIDLSHHIFVRVSGGTTIYFLRFTPYGNPVSQLL